MVRRPERRSNDPPVFERILDRGRGMARCSRGEESGVTIRESRRAAELLRLLWLVEHADAVGDSRKVGRLLAGVDPVEARRLADALDFDAGVRALYQRTRPASQVVERRVW